jgi:hypothetical protein
MAGNQGGCVTGMAWRRGVIPRPLPRANEMSLRTWNIVSGSPFFTGKSP